MDVSLVYSTLERACAVQDAVAQQDAMKSLHDFESQDGFVVALVQILQSDVSQSVVNPDCRLLAAISLKNVVNRCWQGRSSSVRAVQTHEKAGVRKFLLNRLVEPDRKVFVQLSATAAKIARNDWPAEWADVLQNLFSATQISDNWGVRKQAMIMLRDVLSALSSKTVPLSRKVYLETTAQMFPALATTWMQICDNVNSSVAAALSMQDRNREIDEMAEHLTVTTQVLSLVVAKGFPSIAKASDLSPFFASFTSHVHLFSAFLHTHMGAMVAMGSDLLQLLAEEDEEPVSSSGAASSASSSSSSDRSDGGGFEAMLRRLAQTAGTAHGQGRGLAISVSGCVLFACVRRTVRLMGLLLTGLQKEHPLELAPYLGQLLSFLYAHLTQHYGHVETIREIAMDLPAWVPSCIYAVLFLSNTLSCRAYSEDETAGVARKKEELGRKLALISTTGSAASGDGGCDVEAAAAQARELRRQFFDEGRVAGLLELTLRCLLRLGSRELRTWAEDPEEFFISQEGMREQDTIKTAAEGLYLGLLDWAPQLVAAKLTSLLNDLPSQLAAAAVEAAGATKSEDIFLWDGVYLCAGLNTAVLSEYLDLSQWVGAVGGPLLNQLLSDPRAGALQPLSALPPTASSAGAIASTAAHLQGQQVLRARFLWLLGCLSYGFRFEVVEQLVTLLLAVFEGQASSDVVVLMNAITAMQCVLCIEGFSAKAAFGTEAIVRLVGALCNLAAQRLQESDTRARVVDLIANIVDSVGARQLKQEPALLTALITHLTQLWTAADPNSPVRVSVIEAVAAVIKSAGSSPSASSLHMSAIPLIAYATSGSQESSFLCKEGIKLWLVVARNTAPPNYSLAQDELLRAALPSIFERGLLGEDEDDLRELMMVLEASAVAGGVNCLRSSAGALQLALSRTLGQVAARTVPYVTRPMEALLLSCPHDAAAFLLQSGLLVSLLLPCCASMPQLAAKLEPMQEADVAVVAYLSVFARIVLCSPHIVADAVNALAARAELAPYLDGTTGDMLFKGLVRLMLEKFDSVGYCAGGSYRRQLWVLSLLSLYPSHDPAVLDWFVEVVSAADSVLCEKAAEEAEGVGEGASCGSSSSSSSGRVASTLLSLNQESMHADDNGYGSGAADAAAEDKEAIVVTFEALLRNDVVMNASVLAVVQEKLSLVHAVVGDEMFAQGVAASLGPQVLQRLGLGLGLAVAGAPSTGTTSNQLTNTSAHHGTLMSQISANL